MSRKLDSRTLGSLLRMASKGKSKGKRGRGGGLEGGLGWGCGGGLGGLGVWGGAACQHTSQLSQTYLAKHTCILGDLLKMAGRAKARGRGQLHVQQALSCCLRTAALGCL